MNIYKITNQTNNKFYIGKTIHSCESRLKEHLRFANRNGQTYLARSMRKHGSDSFVVDVLEKVEKNIDINEREIYWIDKLNPHYNMTKGGDGGDTSNSPNYKAGMAKRIMPKDNRPPSWKGKHHTEETKKKLSFANKGQKRKPHVGKAAAKSNKNRTVYVCCIHCKSITSLKNLNVFHRTTIPCHKHQ